MGMTASQKILAAHAGLDRVEPGQLVQARLDLVMGNDVTSPMAIREFRRTGRPLWDRDRLALVLDHFTPNKDIKAAQLSKRCREFVQKYGIIHFFDCCRSRGWWPRGSW